jgi:hypothetical protein
LRRGLQDNRIAGEESRDERVYEDQVGILPSFSYDSLAAAEIYWSRSMGGRGTKKKGHGFYDLVGTKVDSHSKRK